MKRGSAPHARRSRRRCGDCRLFVGAFSPAGATASSHREAPLISDDPAADNVDVYAFVSPDRPNTVTLIATYIPFEDPAGGPNYYTFDPTVLYSINVDNNGDAKEDVAYQFRFTKNIANPNSFLYNTGQLTSLTDPDLNIRQTYSVALDAVQLDGLGSNVPVPPEHRPRSNPSYPATMGVATCPAAARSSPARGTIRSSSTSGRSSTWPGCGRSTRLHLIPLATAKGQDGVEHYNTHAIAIQVPKTDLLQAPNADGNIGIYASASRQAIRVLNGKGRPRARETDPGLASGTR